MTAAIAESASRLEAAATRPVNSASVAVLRIAFGLAMVVNTALYLPLLDRQAEPGLAPHGTPPGLAGGPDGDRPDQRPS